MKKQRYQQFIERYEQFNERYSRTVGFRYSEPTIEFELEVESSEDFNPKDVISFLDSKRVKHDIDIIDGNYMKLTITVYNEKEIDTIINQMIERFHLNTNKIGVLKLN